MLNETKKSPYEFAIARKNTYVEIFEMLRKEKKYNQMISAYQDIVDQYNRAMMCLIEADKIVYVKMELKMHSELAILAATAINENDKCERYIKIYFNDKMKLYNKSASLDETLIKHWEKENERKEI